MKQIVLLFLIFLPGGIFCQDAEIKMLMETPSRNSNYEKDKLIIDFVLSKTGLELEYLEFDERNNTNTQTPANKEPDNTPYPGEWHSVKKSYPFSATLKIDSNYNFTYDGGACALRFGSNGNWNLSGDTLILNSLWPEECCYVNDFSMHCAIVDVNSSTAFKITTSTPGCTPQKIYEYILFKNEKFLIKDSTLIHIQYTNNQYPDTKNDFIRVNSN